MKIGKTILMLACGGIAIAASQARADTRGDVLTGIQRCGVIHDDRLWLDCVYGANQPMRAQLGLPPAPEFQQRLVPPPGLAAPPPQLGAVAPPAQPASAPAPRKKPGFFQVLVGNAPPETVSRMVSYRYDKSGAFIVTLENGQEWRQTNVIEGSVNWIKSPSAYMVTVAPGTFGNFSLYTDDSPRKYKVERVK